MELFLVVASVVLCLSMVIALCFLINLLRGNVRERERERNVHNAQVSELLDRLAWKEDKPYGLPPRPPISEEPDNKDLETYMWREV